MLYLYDEAIVKDLQKSFNPNNVPNPVVKVQSVDNIIALAAQIQNDDIQFPLICLQREPDTPMDSSRWNFTSVHKGIPVGMDTKTNDIFYERAVPINLSYILTILTTNTVDMDEIIREITFKYSSQYFLTITIPYESNRKIRFGIEAILDSMDRESGNSEYQDAGKLYQTRIPLVCHGCVLISNLKKKLMRNDYDINIQ